jgi:hypothetical protein
VLPDARAEIQAARNLAVARGDIDLVERLDKALTALDPDRLLTTTQAAEFLGIRSVNTLKVLVRVEGLRTVRHGNRMMIPLSELERIQHTPRLRGLHASDRIHAETSELGAPEGLTPDELAALETGRPGRLPWESADKRANLREPV